MAKEYIPESIEGSRCFPCHTRQACPRGGEERVLRLVGSKWFPKKTDASLLKLTISVSGKLPKKKLHHGDGCYLNLFGCPIHGNPWRPSKVQTINNSDADEYNYSYVPYYKINWCT